MQEISAPESDKRLCLRCNLTFSGNLSFCPSDGAPLSAVTASAFQSDCVPGYLLESIVGRGASGNVYRARNIQTSQVVAIKILNQSLASNLELVRRFKKEAELSSRLSSRHTLAVKSFGLVPDGRPYMVLDFIDGMPAHEIIVPEKGVALKRALPIFVQIAEGLAHAHELGIIHRDIKPTNIMLQRLGGDYYFAKIVDFGIAKQWTSDSGGCTTLGRLTQPGHAVGSPMYMSPEQCIGSNLDHRTDIYSFGCLMYEMLTGRIIFAANNPVVMMNKHVNEQPAPMALPGSPVSEDIERVVFKALAKNRDDRYSEVKELKSNLQNIVARLGSSGNSDSGNAGQTRKESRYGNAFPSQGAT